MRIMIMRIMIILIIVLIKISETILLVLGDTSTERCQTAVKSQKLEDMAADRHKFAARSGKK
jgi:hypothetical protein